MSDREQKRSKATVLARRMERRYEFGDVRVVADSEVLHAHCTCCPLIIMSEPSWVEELNDG